MKKRLCSVVLTAAMVIGLVSPAYGAALPETSVPETTQETVSSGDSAGADSGEALSEEAEEVTEAPAEDAEAVEVYEAAETDGIVYATIEKLTIGQGYIQEPVKVNFSKGDTYADVMMQLLKNLNLSYKSTTSAYGFYLSAIQDNDNSPAVIPQIILDALAKDDDDVSTSRTNQGWLGEFDYTKYSGWMYTVNNTMPNVGMGNKAPADGDVVRFQFSVYGYGSDIGFGYDGDPIIVAADKGPLIKKIAEINEASNQALYGNSYTAAMDVLKKVDATQVEVDAALANLTVPEATSALVTVRAQMAGSYLNGFAEPVTVSSDEAEQYGYTDSVKNGVSALDALVKVHEDLFGEAFTKESASKYLAFNTSGYLSKIFGEETTANGFILNEGYPNDGTKSEYGGYNGTTVTNQAVVDGDVIDFYIYQDQSTWTDLYTWVEVPEGDLYTSQSVTVSVKAIAATMGYLYQTPEEMKGGATLQNGLCLAWVDAETGAMTPVEEVVTGTNEAGENGQAEITLPAQAGDYYLTAVTHDKTYAIANPVKISVKAAVETKITMNRLSPNAKLYALDDTDKTTDLLADVTPTGSASSGYTYVSRLLPGTYVVEGVNGDVRTGTIQIKVSEENHEFTIQTLTIRTKSPSDWVLGVDYTLENFRALGGGDKASAERVFTIGDSTSPKFKCVMVLNGDTVYANAVPSAAHSEYAATIVAKTVTFSTNLDIQIPLKAGLSVTIPYADEDKDGKNDYVLEVGQMYNYYIYSYMEPASAPVQSGETEQYEFAVAQSNSYFYRVTNSLDSDIVTYGNYADIGTNAQVAVEITKEMMYVGQDTNKNTVSDDFSKNQYDTGDLYLNINEKGYLSLQAGETFRLYPYRNWLAVEGFSNAKVIEPDFHVTVLNVEGNDVVSVQELTDNNSSKHSYTLTANSEGTAIVLVTYDAMTYDQAFGALNGNHFMSAIWPENTGVFVVTVGKDNGINTGMTINEGKNTTSKLAGDAYDSELDVLYYVGKNGADYSFTPEEGTKVTTSVCSYEDGKMTFGAFTSDNVINGENGEVTLTGLTQGKTIVRLEKDGKVEYQVLRACELNYKIYKASGVKDADILEENLVYDSETGKLNTANVLKAGDTAVVEFNRFYHPANKLSGIYNMGAYVTMTGEDGTAYKTGGGQYNFASYKQGQRMLVTIPEDWTDSSYVLTMGNVVSSGWGSPYGMHRVLTYEDGKTANFTAVQVLGYFAQLPEIVLTTPSEADLTAVTAVENKIAAIGEVTIDSKAAIEDAEAAYNALTEDQKQLVSNKDVLDAARASYDELIGVVKSVEEKIAAIGEVTIDSKVAIDEAKAAYDALSDAQKAQVSNKDVLEAAIAAYDKFLVETTLHMNRLSPNAKLYALDDTDKTTDLLADVTPTGSSSSGYTYVGKLLPGTYVVEGVNGDVRTGTIQIKVSEENHEFTIQTLTIRTKSPSDWVLGVDYTLENFRALGGGDKASAERVFTIGDSTSPKFKCVMVLNGDTVYANAVPSAAHSEYAATIVAKTVTFSTNLDIQIPLKAGLSVTIPYADEDKDGKNDYVLEVGQMYNYYIYSYMEPASAPVQSGETEQYEFAVAQSNSYFYRVTNSLDSDIVTYGNYADIGTNAQVAVEITKEMMYVGQDTNKNTVSDDFSKNQYDTGDLYLNINEKGYLSLQAGETFRLYPYRNWLAVEGFSNAKVIEPDFHVTVLNVEGNDVVSVQELTDNNSSKHSYTLTANSEGTAIVLVTYDAMTYDQAYGALNGSKFMSAIWPENTGVFVVTVGKDNGINTGMTINEGKNTTSKLAGDAYDSELDVLYYVGKNGADYSFTPEEGTKVTTSVCSYEDGKMTFGAFTSDNVINGENGEVTLTGLTQGKTIVRLEKDGKVEYQVLRACELNYKIYKASGVKDADILEENLVYDSETGKLNMANVLKAGDTAVVEFNRFYHPANKLSGIYNMGAYVTMTGEDGTAYKTSGGQYNFASYKQGQRMLVTIPEDWTDSSYVLTMGNVVSSGWGSPYGMHRVLTYEDGKTANFTAVQVLGYFAQLPEIVLTTPSEADLTAVTAVENKIAEIGEVTIDSKAAIEDAEAAYNALTEDQKQLVSNKDVLDAARAAYEALVAAKADQDAAKAVDDKIAAVGKVTVDSKSKIDAARNAYNKLTDSQKKLVSKYNVLTAAEATYKDLTTGVKGFVNRLYKNILGRNADEAGLNAWVKVLNEGKEGGSETVANFVFSKEYESRKVSDEEFVTTMYKTILGRNPDKAGLDAWVSKLTTGMTRRYVVAGFTNSDEFAKLCKSYGIKVGSFVSNEIADQNDMATSFVSRLYTQVLGRKWDRDGLNAWTAQLVNHETGAGQLSKGFFFSQELLKKNLTSREFVTLCYRTYLDRNPDQAGLDAWVKLMNEGSSMEEILDGFIGSQEFTNMCARYGIDR